jgi:uncharacterized membrane protein (Fun14 family)
LSDIVTPLVYQLGVGAVGGFVVGYAFKKLAKVLIVIIGLFVAALVYLGVTGVISVNYDALWRAVSRLLGLATEAGSWLVGFLSLVPFLGSFAAGAFIGFKLG